MNIIISRRIDLERRKMKKILCVIIGVLIGALITLGIVVSLGWLEAKKAIDEIYYNIPNGTYTKFSLRGDKFTYNKKKGFLGNVNKEKVGKIFVVLHEKDFNVMLIDYEERLQAYEREYKNGFNWYNTHNEIDKKIINLKKGQFFKTIIINRSSEEEITVLIKRIK